jgi:hypothetical protein
MPDVMIAVLVGCALGLASDMPFASECLVSATAAIASETFIRRSHLLPELRQAR